MDTYSLFQCFGKATLCTLTSLYAFFRLWAVLGRRIAQTASEPALPVPSSGGKDNAMKTNESKNRRSSYNPNRACYLTADGKFYCYEVWDAEKKCIVTQKLEVGKDLSVELTILLDESDHDMDLADRYESELRDRDFDELQEKHTAQSDESVDPWNTIADKGNSPEDILLADPEPENPQAAVVRSVIDEQCTEAQQELFFAHFGECRQLEEMRQAEAERTGKEVSPQAFTNRKNKLIDKAAKSLGVERVKRRKSTKKD